MLHATAFTIELDGAMIALLCADCSFDGVPIRHLLLGGGTGEKGDRGTESLT